MTVLDYAILLEKIDYLKLFLFTNTKFILSPY